MSGSNRFREDFEGKGAFKPMADALNALGRALNNIRGFKGINVFVNDRGIQLVGGGRGGPSGTVWVFGKKFTEDSYGQSIAENADKLLRVIKGGGVTGVELIITDMEIPDPMPPNESWRDLTQCVGDIFIDC